MSIEMWNIKLFDDKILRQNTPKAEIETTNDFVRIAVFRDTNLYNNESGLK